MKQQHHPTDLEGEAARDARREQQQRREHEAWVDAIKFVMSDRRGRRFVQRLLKEAAIFNAVFHESHAAMSLLEGKRQLGLFLVDEAERECPNEFWRLLVEQRTNARSE